MKKRILLMLMAMLMIPFISRAQLVIFSENFEGGAIPSTWTQIDADNDGNQWFIIEDYGHNGSIGATSASYDNDYYELYPDNWLITPAITISGAAELSFYVAAQDADWPSEHYGVYVSTTSPTDTASFTALLEETFSVSRDTTPYVHKVISLEDYVGQTIYIAFRHFNCSDWFRLNIDDITVTQLTDDEVINPSLTTVNFGNVIVGDTSTVRVIDISAHNLTSDISVSLASPFEVSVDNESFSTSATVSSTGGRCYVRYIPTAAQTDSTVMTLTSGTASADISLKGTGIDCSVALSIPYFENFDASGHGYETLPACWTFVNNSVQHRYPAVFSGYDAEGGQSLYLFSQLDTVALAISPAIDASAYNGAELLLSFNSQAYSARYSGNVQIGYLTDPDNIYDFHTLYVLDPMDYATYGVWYPFSKTVTINETNPIYLAIRSTEDIYTNVFIDNLSLSATPTCSAPSNLVVSNTTASSALISWEAAPFGVGDYTVEYSVAEQGNWNTQIVAGTSVMLSGLAVNTNYEVRVFPNCTEGVSDTLNSSFATSPCYVMDLSNLDELDTSSVQTITIGDGTSTSYYFPTNTLYNYSYTQQLYTAEEIGQPGLITSISFDYTGTNALSRSIVVYMKNVGRSSFASASDIEPVAASDQVYSGTMSASGASWVTINLAEPFVYNGSDNLMIAIDDNTGSWSSRNFSYTAAPNMSHCHYSDSYNPDPFDMSNYSGSTIFNGYRNNIKIAIASAACDENNTCAKPSVYVTGVDNESVTLGWTPGHEETSWDVQYKLASDTEWTDVVDNPVTENPYTVTDLLAGSEYQFQIRANCGGGQTSEWTNPISATTDCDYLTLPVMEGFESVTASGAGNMISCWTTNTNNSTSYPYASNTQHNTGTYSAYFYGSTSYYSYLISPRFDESVNMSALIVSFYAYKTAATTKIEVGVMSDPNDLSSFESMGIFSPTELNTFEFAQINTTSYTGNGRHIAFRAPMANYTGYMYVDDINIFAVPEEATIVPAVDTIQYGVVIFGDEVTNSFDVITYNLTDVVTATVTAPYTISTNNVDFDNTATLSQNGGTLFVKYTPSTEGDEPGSVTLSSPGAADAVVYLTGYGHDCAVALPVPYVEGFETAETGSGKRPICWSVLTNAHSNGYPYVSTSYAQSGTNSFYLYTMPDTFYYVISPALDLSAYQEGELAIDFSAYVYSSLAYGHVNVGYMTDPTDANTFHLLEAYEPTDFGSTATWKSFKLVLNEHFDDPVHVVFYLPLAHANTNLYIDNIKVGPVPACSSPTNLAASNITGTAALLTWDAAQFGVDDYTVEYSEAGQDTWSSQVVTGTSYMLTGLTVNTEYDVRLFANCSEGSSDTLAIVVTTAPCLVSDPAVSTTVTIGDGTSTTYYFPTNTLYDYSYTQQLFTAAEIQSTGYITDIAFDLTSTTELNRNIVVYMKNVTRTSFASATDNEPVTANDQVYAGAFTATAPGWVTIHLDNPFNYNGTDNLMIAIDDNTGSYSSRYFHYTQASGMSHYYYSDTDNPNPLDMSTYSGSSNDNGYRANIQISFQSDCVEGTTCAVPNPYIVGVTNESVTLGWTPGNEETSWDIQYKIASDSVWTEVAENPVINNPYTVTGLQSGTDYEFQIRSNCGGENSFWTSSLAATTECDFITVPYSENFDADSASGAGVMVPCWNTLTNSSTQYPYISDTQHSSGTHSVYFYGSTSNYSCLVSPRLADDVAMDNLMISFNAYKTSANYFIEVGIMSDPEDISTFQLLGSFSPSTTSTFEMGDVYSTGYTGNGRYVAFRCPVSISNYMYIDDIAISFVPTCMRVDQLVATDITAEEATISWTPLGEETQWEVIVTPTVSNINLDTCTSVVVTDTFYQVTGLTSLTQYTAYVRALCGDINSNWMSVDFRTPQISVDMPYYTNFGENSDRGWLLDNGGFTNHWVMGTPTGANTPALYVSNDATGTAGYTNTSATVIVASKAFNVDTTAEINVSFDVQIGGESSYDYLKVFLAPAETPFEASTSASFASNSYSVNALNFANYKSQSTYSSYPYMYNLTSGNTVSISSVMPNPVPEGGVMKLVFVWKNDGSGGTQPGAIISNVSIFPLVCDAPEVTVSNVTSTGATLTWNDLEASGYVVEYKAANDTAWTTVTDDVTDTTYTLTGLTPATSYTARVAAECDDNPLNFDAVSFITECAPFTAVPVTWTFEDNLTAGSSSYPLPTCWQRDGTTYPYSYNSTTYAYAGTRCLYNYNYYNPQCVSMQEIDRTVLDLDELQVSFFARTTTAGSEQLVVGMMSASGSPATFVPIDTVSLSTTYEFYEVSLNSAVAGSYVAFKFQTTSGYTCIDNVTIEEIPSCPKPNNLTITATTSNSVSIVWNERGDATSWTVEYGETGFTQGSGTEVTVQTTPSTTITGLDAATYYDFYVKSECGAGEESEWLGPVSGVTACDVLNLPYTENFDSYTGSGATGTGEIPLCWDNTYNGEVTNYAPHTYSTSFGCYPHSAPNNLGFYSSSNGIGLAVLPEFSSPLNQLVLDFYYLMENANNGTLSVGYITNPIDPNSFVELEALTSYSHSNYDPQPDTIDFTTYANVPATGRIAFRWVSSSSTYYTCAVDDIHVVESSGTQPTCEAPTNLHQTNIGIHEVTLDWEQEGTPDSWTVYYKKMSANTYTTANTTVHPYTITNLEAETSYEAYVVAVCENGNSSESNHISFVTNPDGVENYELSNTVIYPNPTTSVVTIRNEEVVISEVNVYDVYGKLLKSEKVDNNNANLDLSDLANGMYVVRIVSAEGAVLNRNVVKQ
ncbi:MAG: fibronectin type III domain-containing protein [Bacteroidales bacterium]|nr:fibronectin type III domain-containing protein [Bacteroidales bacterium]